ncbi:MAG: hypothetical protein OXQ92_12355 [Boseongicola sp.]|nr:hypothetical protein [Boseongicola sp.]
MKAFNIAVAVLAVVGLSGCGDRGFSLNPFSWFGSETEVETLDEINLQTYVDDRPLIENVTSLTIDRTPGGAIIRATGLPPTQGWHTAALVSDTEGEPVNGVLSYTFRAVPPENTERVSTVQSREITTGKFVSDIVLANVREIRVIGARNIRSIRR